MDRLHDLGMAMVAAFLVALGQVSVAAVAAPIQIDPDALIRLSEHAGPYVVALAVVLYFYRRDFRQDRVNQQAIVNALLQVVQANTTTMNRLESTNERLARAVEDQNARRRAADHAGFQNMAGQEG